MSKSLFNGIQKVFLSFNAAESKSQILHVRNKFTGKDIVVIKAGRSGYNLTLVSNMEAGDKSRNTKKIVSC